MHLTIASALTRWVRASPLRHERFRQFYSGSAGTALGYTMQATIAAWLMATLTPSALMVALVQTASTAPTLVFGLVAGTLADIVDRRRIVQATQFVLLIGTLVLGAGALAGVVGPASLLAFTFLIGAGFTFYLPAQQAIVNDLVPRTELPSAVALAAVAFNVSRAVGPALAGALAALVGSGSALVASAVFFVWMLFALRGWSALTPPTLGVPETLVSGIHSGLRYVRHSPPLRAFIVRNLSFTMCASALWALLPVIARDQLGLGADGFGMLLGFFGAGAVAGALWIPRHLRRVSLNTLVSGGFVLWAAAASLIAFVPFTVAAVVGTCVSGAAWVSVLASLSAGTQSSAPGWVRARAVSMNLVATQASIAIGSVIWGAVASFFDTRVALGLAAGVVLVLLVVGRRVRVWLGSEADVTIAVQLPELVIAGEPQPDDGPVLIQVEYRVDPENRAAFLRAIHRIEPTRRRNGASSWRIFRDLAEEGRYVERFVIASWAEYMRSRARMTLADRQVQQHVLQLNRQDAPVRVSRLLGIGAPDPDAEDELDSIFGQRASDEGQRG